MVPPDFMTLLPVDAAQQRLFGLAPAIPVEQVPIDDCTGRWLAQPLIARRDQPWASLSAMDGYAIRLAEAPGPWVLAGISSAGDAMPPPLAPGEALRIFTGAPLPPGADAILIQEEAGVAPDGRIAMTGEGPGRAGKHIRPRASDFAEGQLLAQAGRTITPALIGLTALAGHGDLPVHRRIRIALLSSGDELIPPGAPVPAGKLPSSNAPMLRAMLHGLPVDLLELGNIPDDLDAVKGAMQQAADMGADILLSTGGASVGDHDLIRPAFTGIGGDLDFWRIRMRPGKPLMAGRLGDMLMLGLPGNPVSAFATATLFLLPLVRHMSGSPAPLPTEVQARLAASLPATEVRAEYIRAAHENGQVTPVADQDSAAMLALSHANALIRREGSAPALSPGETVPVILL